MASKAKDKGGAKKGGGDDARGKDDDKAKAKKRLDEALGPYRDQQEFGLDTIRAMRKQLNDRLRVLDENERFRPRDEDIKFEETENQIMLDWKTEGDGRTEEDEFVYLYLSSAVRDKNQWPSPGQYQVILESEVNNVIKAALIQASFPLTDQIINATNNKLRYEVPSIPTGVVTLTIPPGNYNGTQMALEMMIQMQLSLNGASLGGGNYLNLETGYIVNTSGVVLPGIEQVRVMYLTANDMFLFQMVDEDELPVSTELRLYIQPQPQETSASFRDLTDDIFYHLGFERSQVALEGTYDAGTNTYYLSSTTATASFTAANTTIDPRYQYAIHGNQAADLRGHKLIVIDIDVLNNNDIALSEDGPINAFKVGDAFGFVTLRSPSEVKDNMVELNSWSYPVQKYYRDGRSRIQRLTITLRRPDGSIYDFNGLDHFMAIRLTVRRTQPEKPVFGR